MNFSVGIISFILQLIPLNSTNYTEYIFKVPDSSVLIREKTHDYFKPFLANITEYGVQQSNIRKLRKTDYEMKWLEEINKSSNESVVNNKIKKLNLLKKLKGSSENVTKKTDDWSILGLHGWEGDIATPSEYIRQTRLVNDKEQSASANYSNSDIFIARSNNPFGHSTKLKLKNTTDQFVRDDVKKSKRNIYNLYSMLKCSTGCSPLSFKGYGCFCGFMGRGTAVDGIDYCCKMHDKCYGSSNCLHYTEYFIPYVWKCYKGKPLCAYSHGDFGGPESCSATLCDCDFQLAICLKKFKCPEKKALCSNSSIRFLQNYIMNVLK